MQGIIRRTRGLTALLVVALAAGAIWLAQGQANAGERGAPRFDAVTLADAVLFNEGPAAPYLDSLGRGHVPWNDTLRDGQKAVHEAIYRDPKWADAFAAGAQSGDPQRVKRALRDLSVVTLESLTRNLGRDRVDEAVYRIIKDVFGDEFADIVKGRRNIPLNLQKVTYPCCLENYVDPLVSSVLVSFMQEVWQIDGVALQVSNMVQELMIGQIAGNLQLPQDPVPLNPGK